MVIIGTITYTSTLFVPAKPAQVCFLVTTKLIFVWNFFLIYLSCHHIVGINDLILLAGGSFFLSELVVCVCVCVRISREILKLLLLFLGEPNLAEVVGRPGEGRGSGV